MTGDAKPGVVPQSALYGKGKSLTVCKWAEVFKSIYEVPDQDRNPEDFWTAVMAHLSSVGEAIRRTHYKDLLRSAAHAFCWMCSYVTKCNSLPNDVFTICHTLPEIVGFKFPMVCGHCIQRPCQCHSASMDQVSEKSARYRDLLDDHWQPNMLKLVPTSTLDWWLKDVFWNLFSSQIHLQTIESIGFHLLEEAGEEAKAVRQLVQFRRIADGNVKGVDKSLLEPISKIPDLVAQYEISIKALKKKFPDAKSEKELKKKVSPADNSPVCLKARLVFAKMDFVIELADSFSWLCAVLLKLGEFFNQNYPKRSASLEKWIREEYKYDDTKEKGTCSACCLAKCKCVFFHRPARG